MVFSMMGLMRMSVFGAIVVHVTASEFAFVGCFIDDADRDLKHGPRDYGYTTASCAEACDEFTFFALQANGYCMCGNAHSTKGEVYFKVDDDECGGPCLNEAVGRCGANYRNAIYQVRSAPGASYVGCYVDDADRDLEVQFTPVTYQYTPITCAGACAEYTYFSLQANGYCQCGNAYGTEAKYHQVDDEECGGPCYGDRAHGGGEGRCGQNHRNAIYRVSTVPGPSYVGCFVDDADRDLELQFEPVTYEHTTVSCAARCSGYTYFSLQAQGYCQCGNAYATEDKYHQVQDSECGVWCYGEVTGRCGRNYRNAVYRVPAASSGLFDNVDSAMLSDAGPVGYVARAAQAAVAVAALTRV